MSRLEDVMDRLQKRFEARRVATSSVASRAAEDKISAPMAASTVPWAKAGCGSHRRSARDPGGKATLFNLRNRSQRPYLDGVSVRLGGIGTLTYRGQELRGDDAAVWRKITDRIHQHPRCAWIELRPRAVLKDMGWGTSMCDRARLRSCLERMQATVLIFPRSSLAAEMRLSLIDRCEWLPPQGTKAGRWRIWVAPELRTLLAGAGRPTATEPGSGKLIGALAKRLQHLFSSYQTPYPRRVETLWRDFGADTRAQVVFRRRLEAALEQLRENGFLADYAIDENDLVRVARAERQPGDNSAHTSV